MRCRAKNEPFPREHFYCSTGVRPFSANDNLRGRYHTISGYDMLIFTLHLIVMNVEKKIMSLKNEKRYAKATEIFSIIGLQHEQQIVENKYIVFSCRNSCDNKNIVSTNLLKK